jgi:hypothetical protein
LPKARSSGRRCRPHAIGHAGLVLQRASRQVQGSARARGDRARLRLRMDQRDRHVRRL